MQRAFSLVELLVVIAIISVLASIMLPGLEHALESSRQIECASRMRQVTMASQMYYDTYGTVVSHSFKFSRTVWTSYHWSHMLQLAGLVDWSTSVLSRDWSFNTVNNATVNGQLRSSSLFLCPSGRCETGIKGAGNPIQFGALSNSATQRDYGAEWSYPFPFKSYANTVTPVSYVLNSALSPRDTGSDPATGLDDLYMPVRNYKEPPSSKLFMQEGSQDAVSKQFMQYWGTYSYDIPSPNGHWRSYYQIRHGGYSSMNYACMDGHVSRIPWDTIYLMTRNWNLSPWLF